MFTSRPSVACSASAIGVTRRLRTLSIGLLALSCTTAMHYVGPISSGDDIEPWRPPVIIDEPAIPRCGSTGQCHNWTVCKCCTLNNVWGVTCHDESETSCLHEITVDSWVGMPIMANDGYGPAVYASNQEGLCAWRPASCTGNPDSPCDFILGDWVDELPCADYIDPGLPSTCP